MECKNTSDTGTGSTRDKWKLSNIPGKHDIKNLQKTAILGTAHTNTYTRLPVNINVKVGNFVLRNYIVVPKL